MRFVDSHVHFSDLRNQDEVLSFAKGVGMVLLSSGIDRKTSKANLAAQEEADGVVRAFVGVHPSEAGKEDELGWLSEAVDLASGVGEIGLDPKYSDVSPDSVQMGTFLGQLRAAEKAGKPVQVHSRGAERECLDELRSFGLRSVLMHWFEKEELLRRVTDAGYFISFGPSLVTSKKLRRMAGLAERSLILAETDGPVAFKGLAGMGGPQLLPSVVFSLAETLRIEFEECRELLVMNSERFLSSGGKG